MNITSLFVILLITQRINGIVTQSSTLTHNALGCTLVVFNDQLLTHTFYNFGSGTSFPSCPSSTVQSPSLYNDIVCVTNLNQGVLLLQETATTWAFARTNPFPDPTNIVLNVVDWGIDTTGGTSDSLFNIMNSSPFDNYLNCYNAQDESSSVPAGTTPCVGKPDLMVTLCVYTNSICDLDGDCHMDTLASSFYAYEMTPFVSGVWADSLVSFSITAAPGSPPVIVW
jgi:hypothetical protein